MLSLGEDPFWQGVDVPRGKGEREREREEGREGGINWLIRFMR